MPLIIVLDLDGTIADNAHRQHLLPTGCGSTTEQWDAFNKACEGDAMIEQGREFLRCFQLGVPRLYKLVVVTGRSEVARKETDNWLEANAIFYNEMYMRPADDHRKAVHWKREVFQKIINANAGNSFVFMEDDPAIVEMINQDLGQPVLFMPSKCSAVVQGKGQSGE